MKQRKGTPGRPRQEPKAEQPSSTLFSDDEDAGTEARHANSCSALDKHDDAPVPVREGSDVFCMVLLSVVGFLFFLVYQSLAAADA